MWRFAVAGLGVALVVGLAIPSVVLAQDLNVKVVSVTSPVKVGGQAKLTVETAPKARCTPNLQSKSGAANYGTKVTGLNRKTADSHGMVGWNWRVPPGTTAGIWPIEITCSAAGKQVKTEASVTVQ
jgi:hypothetical protein